MCPAAQKQKIGDSEILRRQNSIYDLSPGPFRNAIRKNKENEIAAGGKAPSAAVARVSYAFGRMGPFIRDVQATLFHGRERCAG